LRSKVAPVRRQLEAVKSVILYNTEDSSTAIMMTESVPDEVKSDISSFHCLLLNSIVLYNVGAIALSLT